MLIRLPAGAGSCCLVLLLACSGGDAPPADLPLKTDPIVVIPEASPAEIEAEATARQAADGLGRDLMGLLLAKLAEAGPGAAIAYCADSAQARTASIGTTGVQIRRVSMKPRNLANAPEAFEEELLDVLAQQYAAGRMPPDTSIWIGTGADRELRHLRPIIVQQPCLACHGNPEEFAPEVRKVLAERYPDDQATGYAAGDFRGAISVQVSLSGP